MSTIDNLKLRNIEVLDSMTLRAAASSSGDAIDGGSLPEVVVYGSAGSKSSSGSGTEGAMGAYFASWYYGSGSSSGSDSSSGSEYQTKYVAFSGTGNSWMGPADYRSEESVYAKIGACQGKYKDANCEYRYGNVVDKGFCTYYNYGNSDKSVLKCHSNVPEHEACDGKKTGWNCSFINKYGNRQDEKCSSFALGGYKGLYCSDLPVHQ